MFLHRSRGKVIGFSLALAFIGVGALVFGNIPAGVAALAASGGLMLFHFSKGRVDRPSVPTSNDVSTPSKMRVKPIVKLREQVVNLIETNKSNPVVSAMAFDTLSEVDSIVMRAMDILDAKRRLQRLSAAVYPSRAAVETLENKVLRSTDSTAKMSIEQALNTRREELRILEELEAEAHRLDANLDEAEAALAELRTQLLKVVAASPKQQALEEMDPLSGMTDRLRRISTTMEESVEMVTTRIGDN
jgi:DNA repair exonuclease SbcCD ATPase subunit